MRLAGLAAMVGLIGPGAILALPGVAATTAASFQCKVVFGSTPAALAIPNAEPNSSVPAGAKLGFQYEVAVVNYTPALYGKVLRIPETRANFPVAGGGALAFYQIKRNVTITGSAWTDPNLTAAGRVLTAAATFPAGDGANLSTQKLAVMVNDSYGSVELAARWRWTETAPNGTLSDGPWSVPNATAFHPSILYPAPYVTLVTRNPATVDLGSNVTATLGGAISREAFFLELERPDGTVFATKGLTAPAGNATPFLVSIRLENRAEDLPAGPELLHIHDHCGDMLMSLPVTGALPSQATVTLRTNTSACASVDLNGTTYPAGTPVTVTPSASAESLVAPSCTGYSFHGWSAKGGLHVTTPSAGHTSVRVTYNGTLTADYA